MMVWYHCKQAQRFKKCKRRREWAKRAELWRIVSAVAKRRARWEQQPKSNETETEERLEV